MSSNPLRFCRKLLEEKLAEIEDQTFKDNLISKIEQLKAGKRDLYY